MARRATRETDATPASAAAPAWGDLERRLAEALAAMHDESYLLLTTQPGTDDRAFYVQFAWGEGTLRSEAVGSAYLPSDHALTKRQEAQLTRMGWNRPRPEEATRNFYRDDGQPVPYAEAAARAIETLRDVYGVTSPDDLRYLYRSFRDEAVPTLDLGIEPEERPVSGSARPEAGPAGPELRELVEAGLRQWLMVGDLVTDEDGDYPCRSGSAMVFVRIVDGTPPFVTVFSPILRDIDASPALLTALNDLNLRIRFGRVFWARRQVIAMTEITGVDVTPDQVALTCIELGNLADTLDDVLHGRFGGRTMFEGGPRLLN
jgi:T3SS (YopN, CesT) and YbjN peptide-binding chaperone 1/T3SS (YopN, CesT) and YbjN peptide-binding chaperone 3